MWEICWTHFSDPPLIHPTMWTGESNPIFTVDIQVMGGFVEIHIAHIHVNGFDSTGCNGTLSVSKSHKTTLDMGNHIREFIRKTECLPAE